MIIDNTISNFIDKELLLQNEEEKKLHNSSGKLTAGFLYQPKRFQLMKYLGVEQKQPDLYALRKFARGKAVEDWYLEYLNKAGLVIETQKEVNYRGVIGIVDALLDTDKMQFRKGILPHEIKSVTNRNFKWIYDKGDISWHYHLQACFYAMALKTEYYALDFIASDDLRDYVTIHKTRDYKHEVDVIITQYDEMVAEWNKNLTVPDFITRDKWQNNPNYMPYESVWAEYSSKQFVDAIKNYPGKLRSEI